MSTLAIRLIISHCQYPSDLNGHSLVLLLEMIMIGYFLGTDYALYSSGYQATGKYILKSGVAQAHNSFQAPMHKDGAESMAVLLIERF